MMPLRRSLATSSSSPRKSSFLSDDRQNTRMYSSMILVNLRHLVQRTLGDIVLDDNFQTLETIKRPKTLRRKKLPNVKIQIRRTGKAEANRRLGISKKVMEGVNQGRTSQHSKILIIWLTKGNSLSPRKEWK